MEIIEGIKYYTLEELKVKPDNPLWLSLKEFAERWPDQEPQVGVGIGKAKKVTSLKEYFQLFGDIIKVRYSKRRGYRGILKRSGRKVYLW
jgi:hypothetical protein